jgi:hypothetical protein
VILGVSFHKNRVLFAKHNGVDSKPEFLIFSFDENSLSDSKSPGWLWPQIGEDAKNIFNAAEKAVLALPSKLCYLKRLEIKTKYLETTPAYLDWLASTQLPGGLDGYKFGFIKLGESFDLLSQEMLLFACLESVIGPIISSLEMADMQRELILIPEQLGLVRTLERSLSKGDIAQAAVVNFDSENATVVHMLHNRYSSSRLFAITPEQDLSTDIETYLLSRADTLESLPLVITGNPNDFHTSWSPIVPAFLGIHDLEYATAWGVADYEAAE